MASQMQVRGLPKAVPVDSNAWSATFSEAFHELECASDKFWKTVDECTSLCTAYESYQDGGDVGRRLREMRKAYATSSSVLETVRTYMNDTNIKTTGLALFVNRFETHISRTALNYGLNLLPDEVLLEVLFCAADTLEETVALSRVCKRFHLTILSSQQFWRRFRLSSLWSPEQILAIAERSGLDSLTAWVTQRGDALDLTPSEKTILSLSPYLAELQIFYSDDAYPDQILKAAKMPALCTLGILRLREPSPFSTSGIFYEVYDMPLLQELRVEIAPSPSLARNLVRCYLKLCGRVRLQLYLDFLFSANLLRELAIWVASNAVVAVHQNDSLRTVTLPSMDTLKVVYEWTMYGDPLNHLLVERIQPCAVRRLTMSAEYMSEEFMTLLRFVRVIPSVRTFDLSLRAELKVDDILAVLPPQLESLSFTAEQGLTLRDVDHDADAFSAYGLNCIRFLFGTRISEEFVRDLRSYFQNVGHTAMEFSFQGCHGARDGAYTIDTVESALTAT